jgi:hypothetical protein
VTTAFAVVALILSVIAAVSAVLALRILGQLRASVAVLNRGADSPESLLEAAGRQAQAAAELSTRYGEIVVALDQHWQRSEQAGATLRSELGAAVARATEHGAKSLRRVALVRYDAFEDLAGRMSFSLALLDDHGDGVAISGIIGRTDSRVYAKGVAGATGSPSDLSPEETQAVQAAMADRT